LVADIALPDSSALDGDMDGIDLDAAVDETHVADEAGIRWQPGRDPDLDRAGELEEEQAAGAGGRNRYHAALLDGSSGGSPASTFSLSFASPSAAPADFDRGGHPSLTMATATDDRFWAPHPSAWQIQSSSSSSSAHRSPDLSEFAMATFARTNPWL